MIDFASGAINVDNAIQLTLLLDAIDSPTSKAVIDNVIGMSTGQPVVSTYLRYSSALSGGPSFYYGESGGYGLLLIGHTPNLGYGEQVYNDYCKGIWPTARTIEHAAGKMAAQYMKANIERAMIPLAGNILISGHSFGGVVADYYAKLLIDNGFPTQPLRITFGAPKSGGVDTFQVLSPQFGVRWMNEDDPVPLIPPHTFPALNLFAVGVPFWMRNASAFCHQLGGLSLNSQGQVTAAILPPLATFSPGINLGAWLFNTEVGRDTPHALLEYTRRLRLLKDLLAAPGHSRITPSRVEPLNQPARQEMNQQAQAAVNAIFATGAEQNAQPVEIPGGGPFYAFREGRVWQVAFGASVVAIGPTKRKARAIANRANDWLRHLQQSGAVDIEGTVLQLQEYLIQASDPTGQFRPVMRTALPVFRIN